MYNRSGNAGFTLFELVIVILIVGILATFAAPRLNLSTFQETGFYQQATSAIRFAQKRAVASGCIVQVSITNGGCNLNWVGCASNASLRNPSNNSTNFCGNSTPAGAVINGSFRFDSIGRPTDNADTILNASQNVTIGPRTIVIEAETGYAHD